MRIPSVSSSPDWGNLLPFVRRYLTVRQQADTPSQTQEATWKEFYDVCDVRIRRFAGACKVSGEELVDCVQEVWRELLVRLPDFDLNPERGRFESWLFAIVRSKAANIHLSRQRFPCLTREQVRLLPAPPPEPCLDADERMALRLCWERLRKRLSHQTFEVVRLRLIEEKPVAEVSKQLNLSREQVWYRFHRGKRELTEMAEDFNAKEDNSGSNRSSEKMVDSAQGKDHHSVSQFREKTLHC